MEIRRTSIGLLAAAVWSCAATTPPATTTANRLLDLTVADAIRWFGASTREPGRTLCYRDPHRRLFLSLWPWSGDDGERLGYVFVGRESDCEQSVESRVALPEVMTDRGLRLGDSFDTLVRLHGRPSGEVTASEREGMFSAEQRERFGAGRELQYSERDAPVLSVFVKDDRVVAFALWIPD